MSTATVRRPLDPWRARPAALSAGVSYPATVEDVRHYIAIRLRMAREDIRRWRSFHEQHDREHLRFCACLSEAEVQRRLMLALVFVAPLGGARLAALERRERAS